MRASVWASSVLPEPVGPTSRMLDLASSTSLFFCGVVQALVVIVDGNGQDLLGIDLVDDIIIEHLADFLRASARRPWI